MESVLDFRSTKPKTIDEIAAELIELTRQFSNYAHTHEGGAAAASSSSSSSNGSSILSHISQDLVYRTNSKQINGRDAYIAVHQRILTERPEMRFRIWDLRADVHPDGNRGKVWMTADLFGAIRGDTRAECSFVFHWVWKGGVWVCHRIGGLTSMGAFSYGL